MAHGEGCVLTAVRGLALRLLVGLALVAPCSVQSPAAQVSEYVIGPSDVLGVTVWSQVDLTGKYTVAADGTFTFPLIGAVKAAGLTLREIEAELRKRLADGYFVDPQLSVKVEEYHSQRIFVVGQVRQPGSYPLSGDMTLIEALARAGSTTGDAAAEALIVRVAPGTRPSGPVMPDRAKPSEVIRVNINELQSGVITHTVTLRDGDTIFVPRAETAFVSGQVRTPGAYPVGKNTTVLQAITLAGGFTDRAAANRIKIIRIVNGTKQDVKVKLTDVVQPGDTILVPERFF